MIKQIDSKYQMVSLVYQVMSLPFLTEVIIEGEAEAVMGEIEMAQAGLESYLDHVDAHFSPFKENSELSRYNRGELDFITMSDEMRFVYVSCAQANEATKGAFNPNFDGSYNPSGFVKGWAIEEGFKRYLKPLLEAPTISAANLNGGGDMQMETCEDSTWLFSVGIIDPFDKMKVIAVESMKSGAIATSGIMERGNHIAHADKNLVQTTVIGNSLQEVDVWATALMVKLENKLPRHLRAFAVDRTGKIIKK